MAGDGGTSMIEGWGGLITDGGTMIIGSGGTGCIEGHGGISRETDPGI